LAGSLEGILVGHGDHFVDHVQIEDLRDEPGPDSLDRMLAWLQRLPGTALGDHRADGRFHGHDLHEPLAGLEHLAHAGDRAAGPHAGNEDVDPAARVAPDFLGGGLAMDLRVGRVLELLGHEITRIALGEFFRAAHRSGHALQRGREDDLGSQGLQQPPALEAHALGHGHLELVAPGRADKGQADARVAAGGLDDHRVGLDLAFPLGGVNHCPADTVLDAPQRIGVLELGDHRGCRAGGNTVQTHQGRLANALRDVVVNLYRRTGRHEDPPRRRRLARAISGERSASGEMPDCRSAIRRGVLARPLKPAKPHAGGSSLLARPSG
jgi:hypothetical protein